MLDERGQARPESRCLVPFTSFGENEMLPDGWRPPVVCARSGVTAGVLRRDLEAGLGQRDHGAECRGWSGHPKAMPMILTAPKECATWMSALAPQRPLPDDALVAVARGEKQDPPTSVSQTRS